MEKHELYDGSVVMEYYDDDHKYIWDGVDLPTSTQITGIIDKPALRYWYLNQALSKLQSQIKPGKAYDEIQLAKIFKGAKYSGTDARDNAANIGRLVHDWIESYVKAQLFGGKHVDVPFPLHTGARKSVEAFLRWEEKAKPDYVFSERRLLSKEHMFAGTLDIAAYIDGKPFVVDIKTGKGVYPEYWLQTASYALMLAEESPSNFSHKLEDIQRMILLIPQATGKLKQHYEDSLIVADAETFIALRRVFLWKENR